MHTTADCGCGCGGSATATATGAVSLERTRFFARQVVDADDLTQDQLYFRDRMRRHNRLMHGWGIVCGARVAARDGCEVEIEPGYILGPQGDEIVIEQPLTVDLCVEGPDGFAHAPCGADPWCTDVRVERHAGRPVYLAIRYAECETRPVRAHGASCGCDDWACEYSRVRDSFAVKVLSEPPASYLDTGEPNFRGARGCEQGAMPACLACPAEPWVLLAAVTVADGRIEHVDCANWRRYAYSDAGAWFRCTPSREALPLGYGLESRSSMMMVEDLDAPPGAVPRGTVALARAGGETVAVPAYFEVEPGETFGELIDRVGDHRLRDPETGEVRRLKTLFEVAGVDRARPVARVADALAPLEGLPFGEADTDWSRERMSGLVESQAFKAIGEEPADALELKAEHVRGVGRSVLRTRLGDRTVTEVAATPQERFVEEMREGLSGARAREAGSRAAKVWESARMVAALARASGGG